MIAFSDEENRLSINRRALKCHRSPVLEKPTRSNIEFQYFPMLDDAFGGLQYFLRGTSSDGHRAMFEWIRKQTSR